MLRTERESAIGDGPETLRQQRPALTAMRRNRTMAGNGNTESPEIWKPVVGFEGSYEVSNLGRVKALARTVLHGRGRRMIARPEMLMRTPVTATGYPQVLLKHGDKTRHSRVHRLVCEAFHGPAPVGSRFAAHVNGDPSDCRASNLAWVSPQMNAHHKVIHSHKGVGGRIRRGDGKLRVGIDQLAGVAAVILGKRAPTSEEIEWAKQLESAL